MSRSPDHWRLPGDTRSALPDQSGAEISPETQSDLGQHNAVLRGAAIRGVKRKTNYDAADAATMAGPE